MAISEELVGRSISLPAWFPQARWPENEAGRTNRTFMPSKRTMHPGSAGCSTRGAMLCKQGGDFDEAYRHIEESIGFFRRMDFRMESPVRSSS